MDDLTVIFLTINKLPKSWSDFQMEKLKEAIGDYPVISVSKTPMEFGLNLIQEEEPSAANIYHQMLRAAKVAETKYVAIAEDDVLYPYIHFHSFRPPKDAFAYNTTRWQNHSWSPVYYWRKRTSNFALISPRELMIEALEERFSKCTDEKLNTQGGELGRDFVENRLEVTHRKIITFETHIALVCMHHDYGLDRHEKTHTKKISNLRATSIPYWGDCADLAKKFYEP